MEFINSYYSPIEKSLILEVRELQVNNDLDKTKKVCSGECIIVAYKFSEASRNFAMLTRSAISLPANHYIID